MLFLTKFAIFLTCSLFSIFLAIPIAMSIMHFFEHKLDEYEDDVFMVIVFSLMLCAAGVFYYYL